MPLFERLGGVHATRPKIPVHQFQALNAERVSGNLTGPQANTKVAAMSGGVGLDSAEAAQADAIAALVTGITVPAVPTLPTAPGSPTAANVSTYCTQVRNYAQAYSQRVEALTDRNRQVAVIDRVLLLLDIGAYTPAEARTRLGVS